MRDAGLTHGAFYSHFNTKDELASAAFAHAISTGVVLVLHDWGSALGFDWANRHRDRVAGIAYMEAITTPMTWADRPDPVRKVFQGFRSANGESMVPEQNMFVENVLRGAIRRTLTDEEMDHCRAPFREPGEGRRPPCRGRGTSRSTVNRPTSSASSRT